MINKHKNKLFKEPSFVYKTRHKRNDVDMFNKELLGGSYYKNGSKPNDIEKETGLHVNSMIKARLQGNILEVIKRNAEIQKNCREKPLESVIELPSRMFSTTRDAPNISLFRKPPKKQAKKLPVREPNARTPMDTSELQNTIQFKPPVTSTPFGNSKSFVPMVTPEPRCVRNSNMNEKYEQMCQIMNNQSELISKTLFKDVPTQISNTRQELQEVFEYCRSKRLLKETYQSPEVPLNKTYVIESDSRHLETPSILRPDIHSNTPITKSPNTWLNPMEFLTQTVQNPIFHSEMLPFFETPNTYNEKLNLFGSPIRATTDDKPTAFSNFFNGNWCSNVF